MRRWVGFVAGPALAASRRAASLGTRGRIIRRYLHEHPVRKLQIGCGSNCLPGWLNTELSPNVAGCVYFDARRPLPLDDGTIDYIFSEHMIEHIGPAEAERFLRECLRALRPGGKVRLATPDLRFLADLLRPEKTDVQRRYIDWVARSWLPGSQPATEAAVVNNFFYNFGHRFIYDFETLKGLLERCGFREVAKRLPGESPDETLRGIERHQHQIGEEFNRLETMVVEAVKPRSENG
jgi:predicted SAM-dependent methyltransferase